MTRIDKAERYKKLMSMLGNVFEFDYDIATDSVIITRIYSIDYDVTIPEFVTDIDIEKIHSNLNAWDISSRSCVIFNTELYGMSDISRMFRSDRFTHNIHINRRMCANAEYAKCLFECRDLDTITGLDLIDTSKCREFIRAYSRACTSSEKLVINITSADSIYGMAQYLKCKDLELLGGENVKSANRAFKEMEARNVEVKNLHVGLGDAFKLFAGSSIEKLDLSGFVLKDDMKEDDCYIEALFKGADINELIYPEDAYTRSIVIQAYGMR